MLYFIVVGGVVVETNTGKGRKGVSWIMKGSPPPSSPPSLLFLHYSLSPLYIYLSMCVFWL